MHRLHRKWKIWFVSADTRSSTPWKDRLVPVHSFDTVQGFWEVFNSIVSPRRLRTGAELYLFEETDVPPSYEAYPEGGIWSLMIPKDQPTIIEDAWLALAMSVVGETMNGTLDILGIVMSVKYTQYRLSLWTRTAEDQDVQMTIGRRFRDITGLDTHCFKIEYRPNQQTSTGLRLSKSSGTYTA